VRPGASLQSVSPHDRHEPIGLASRDASLRHGKLQFGSTSGRRARGNRESGMYRCVAFVQLQTVKRVFN
jgi:hypothetical protein